MIGNSLKGLLILSVNTADLKQSIFMKSFTGENRISLITFAAKKLGIDFSKKFAGQIKVINRE